jgi:hypothetical protein
MAALPNIRRSPTAVAGAATIIGLAAIRPAVEAATDSGRIAADVDDQLLFRGNGDNGMHAPPIGYRGTSAFGTTSNDLEVRHARRHFEVLSSAGVVERLMVRKRVRRGVVRHDAATGAAAAACKHCRGHASAYHDTAKLEVLHLFSPSVLR